MNNRIIEDIEYRKLIPTESKKYRLLRLESLQKYPNNFGSKFEEQKLKSKLAFEKFIEESNQECIVVGALKQDQLIGICGFYRRQDNKSRHIGELVQMYVKTEYQGKSVGYNLLKATINIGFQFEKLKQIELEVMTDATAANKIYEKVGFEESEIQRITNKNMGDCDQRIMILFRDKMFQ